MSVVPYRRSWRALIALTAAIVLSQIAPVQADTRCPTIDGGTITLTDADVEKRLTFIQLGLEHEAHNARIYAWTWAGLYSTSATINLARIPFSVKPSQKDAAVASAGSLIGVGALAFLPLRVMSDQRHLDRLIASSPKESATESDRCALLAQAERFLIRDATSEAFGKSPLVHVGNFALNIGLGLLEGIGFGHWQSAAITILSGITVGEIQVASQPTGAVDLLERYRAGNLGPIPAAPTRGVAIIPSVSLHQYSLQLVMPF